MSLPTKLSALLLAVAFLVHFDGNQAGAQIVFDNTQDLSTSTSFGPGCCLSGLEVELSGSATLNQLEWVLSGQSSGVDDADIIMAIFANDGFDGSPNTLLWEETFEDLVIAPGFGFYSFDLPNVAVPDNITITSRVLDSSPIATGFAVSNSTSVGNAIDRWVLTSSGDWARSQSSFRSIRLTAIPEPGAAIVLTAFVATTFLRRRR